VETTALGAACLACLATGMWSGLDGVAAPWQLERTFEPAMPRGRAAELMAAWECAVRQATHA
jgi:glycerol kinase